jgi:hypothetical protein
VHPAFGGMQFFSKAKQLIRKDDKNSKKRKSKNLLFNASDRIWKIEDSVGNISNSIAGVCGSAKNMSDNKLLVSFYLIRYLWIATNCDSIK